MIPIDGLCFERVIFARSGFDSIDLSDARNFCLRKNEPARYVAETTSDATIILERCYGKNKEKSNRKSSTYKGTFVRFRRAANSPANDKNATFAVGEHAVVSMQKIIFKNFSFPIVKPDKRMIE